MQDVCSMQYIMFKIHRHPVRVQCEKTEAEAHKCNLDRVPKVALDSFGR
jgi:hypothetical protein